VRLPEGKEKLPGRAAAVDWMLKPFTLDLFVSLLASLFEGGLLREILRAHITSQLEFRSLATHFGKVPKEPTTLALLTVSSHLNPLSEMKWGGAVSGLPSPSGEPKSGNAGALALHSFRLRTGLLVVLFLAVAEFVGHGYLLSQDGGP
jgi:hypothetical protein